MAVYRHKDRWMASVGAGQKRSRRLFDTEGEALAWEQAQKPATGPSGALPGHVPSNPKCWTLRQALTHTHMHQWKGRGGERKALLNAQQALDFFGPDTPVTAINAGEVLRYMTHLIGADNAPATRNKKLSALRVMLGNAVDYGGLDDLPKMKRVKEKRQPAAWFKEEDEATMLATCEKLGYFALRDFIIIGIDSGFRSGELLGLTMEQDVEGAFVLNEGETKSGEPRRVPHSPRVEAIVQARREVGASMVFPGLTLSTLRGQWENLRCHMGREEDPMFTPHKLRHTCATRMAAKGVPLVQMQAWLGHEVIETTMRYAHLSPGALDAAKKQMWGPGPAPVA